MSETEKATLAMMVLKLCRERGLTQAEVLKLFSKDAVRYVFEECKP